MVAGFIKKIMLTVGAGLLD